MAFLPYVRLSLRGVIDSVQTWSVNMSFSNDGTATSGELLTWLTSVDTLAKAWFTAAPIKTRFWDVQTSYTGLAAYAYPAAGGASAQAALFSSGVTGSGTAPAPRQCALVYSLRSGVAGRSGRGRIYVPVTNALAYSTNGQLSSADCGTAATAFKTFIDAMNVLSIGTSPAVLGIASVGAGQHTVSTDVVVNSLVDTQRRRTDKLAASFQSIAIF